MRYTFFVCLILTLGQARSQNSNSGFLGKKIAVSYGGQLSIPRYIFGNPGAYKHNFNFECATFKYQSISAHMSYKKVTMPYEKIKDDYDIDYGYYLSENVGHPYSMAKYVPMGGSADIRSLSIGARFNFYYKRKTVASPAGFCQYLRIDYITDKVLENNFTYALINENDLPYPYSEYAKTKKVQKPGASYALSIGFGLESKRMLTSSLFVAFNVEVNLNTYLLREVGVYLEEIDSGQPTRQEDLKEIGRGVDAYKNILLVGYGIGFLL